MKKAFIATAAVLSLSLVATAGFCAGKKGSHINGQHEFQEHCAVCHPNGGNIIHPQKTLHKKVLAANGVKSAKDIVAKMRNPGPGMTKFDEKTIPNNEAMAIANYILKTFK